MRRLSCWLLLHRWRYVSGRLCGRQVFGNAQRNRELHVHQLRRWQLLSGDWKYRPDVLSGGVVLDGHDRDKRIHVWLVRDRLLLYDSRDAHGLSYGIIPTGEQPDDRRVLSGMSSRLLLFGNAHNHANGVSGRILLDNHQRDVGIHVSRLPRRRLLPFRKHHDTDYMPRRRRCVLAVDESDFIDGLHLSRRISLPYDVDARRLPRRNVSTNGRSFLGIRLFAMP